MKKLALILATFLAVFAAPTLYAQVPQIINYQGRMTVGGVNFNGNGQFKFALVDGAGTVLWSNAPIVSGQPNSNVVLPVTNGIYSVFLGDTTLANMAAIPATVFSGADVRVRIWFNNGTLGFQQLAPDQRIAAVGYAMMADGVKDGAITSAKLAAGAVTSTKLGAGAVTSTAIANGAVTAAAIANGAVGGTQLAAGAVAAGNIADGAITSVKIANGAVTGMQIANGAISTTKLSKQYDSGRVSLYDYDIAGFPTGTEITVPFNFAFNTEPNVSLGTGGSDTAFLASLRPTVKSKNNVDFHLLIEGISRTDTEILATSSAELSSRGAATPVVTEIDMITLPTGPAMAYIEAGRLVYRRALDSRGTTWADAINLDTTTGAGTRIDLVIQNGNPAVAYTTSAGVLYFIRATDATGLAWGARGTVIASGVNSRPVAGDSGVLPAIVTHDFTNNRLQFSRATNAAGTTWAATLALTGSSTARAEHWDFATVNGQPAVVFSGATSAYNADLYFLRSTTVDGSAWPASASVIVQDPVYTRLVGNLPRLLMINGKPSVFYANRSYFSTQRKAGAVFCSRGTDASGSGWINPVRVAEGENSYTQSGSFSPGEAGGIMHPGIVGGVPMLLTVVDRSISQYADSTETKYEALCLFQAGDEDGLVWSAPTGAPAGVNEGSLISLPSGVSVNFGRATEQRPRGQLQSMNSLPCWASCATNEANFITFVGGRLTVQDVPSPEAGGSQSNGALSAITLPSGKPLLAFFDPGEKAVKVSSGVDTNGATWTAPKKIGWVGGGLYLSAYGDAIAHNYGNIFYTGIYGSVRLTQTATGQVSLGGIQGLPAIAYTSGSPTTTVSLVKATGYTGLTWGSPVSVFSGTGIWTTDIKLLNVNGNPAIVFRQDSTLKIVRATSAAGTAWNVPVTIGTDASIEPVFCAALIGGNPAVAFSTSSGATCTVKFLRATDASGTVWPAATTAQTLSGFVADSGNSLSLAEISGTPGIAVRYAATGKLSYTRSSVAAGTSGWSTALNLDTTIGTGYFTGERGVELIAGSNPVVIYEAIDGALESDLRSVAANDSTGASWAAPTIVLTDGNVGEYPVAAVTEGGIIAACYDFTRDLVVRLKSNDGGQSWSIISQTTDIPFGEHLCAAMAGGFPAVFMQGPGGLYYSRASDAEGTTWTSSSLVDSSTPGGIGLGFFPSAATIGGRLCVAYYDADLGNIDFKRGSSASGGFGNPSVNIAASGDVGGYASLAEVNGRPAVSYYNFTSKTLIYKRASDAIGSAWDPPVTVVGITGNGEYCQLTILGGVPVILYYDAVGKRLMLVRASDVSGAAWGTPEVVDDGVTSNRKADVGRFAKLAIVSGKPSVVYTDSTNKDLLYKRAIDANGTSWGSRVILASNDDTGLFPTLLSLGNIPSVFHFDRTRKSIRNILPTLPFSVGWTAVEP